MVSGHRDQVRPRDMLPFDGMPKRFSRFYGIKRFKGGWCGASSQKRRAVFYGNTDQIVVRLNQRFPNMRYSRKMRRLKAGMRRRVTCD